MITFEEFRSKISIIELAQKYGYVYQSGQGAKYPVYYNKAADDKIAIVNKSISAQQGYFNIRNNTDKGALYNFVKTRMDMGIIPRINLQNEAASVNHVLFKYLDLPQEVRTANAQIPISSTEKDNVPDFSKAIGILEQKIFLYKRGFRDSVINSKLFTNRIFNTAPGYGYTSNVIFPLYDANNDIVGLESRNDGWKMFVPGTNRSIGIWRSNAPERVDSVVIAESALDCLSYHAIAGGNNNTLYIAFDGNLTQGQIKTIDSITSKATLNPECKITLACDNDAAGQHYNMLFTLNEMGKKGVDISWLPSGESNKVTLQLKGAEMKMKNVELQIENFNRKIEKNAKEIAGSGYACKEPCDQKIICDNKTDSVKINFEIKSFPQLNFLNRVFNLVFSLPVVIKHPVLNDFNDDLMMLRQLQQKGIQILYSEFASKPKELIPYFNAYEKQRLAKKENEKKQKTNKLR